ncbi:hypothetical protein [Neoroseomonas terrae]|nr:hypothetical protein [Neoroseomonas terrae]
MVFAFGQKVPKRMELSLDRGLRVLDALISMQPGWSGLRQAAC